MKAVRALMKDESDKSNLAFLDPSATKVKGWSNDANVVLASAERMGNRALVLAICGAILGTIGNVGGMVSYANKFGTAGAIISALPSGIGLLCMGLAVLMAVIVVGFEVYCKFKQGKKIGATFWSAVGAIVVVVLYFVLQRFFVV